MRKRRAHPVGGDPRVRLDTDPFHPLAAGGSWLARGARIPFSFGLKDGVELHDDAPPPPVERSAPVAEAAPTTTRINAHAWDDDFARALSYHSGVYRTSLEQVRCVARVAGMTRDLRVSRASSGQSLYEKIVHALDNCGVERAPHQVQFHDAALNAASKLIYKEDFMEHQEEIFRRTNTKELRQEILAQMPRRYGKTTMVAMWCAVMIWFVPGLRIGIFSTGSRTSKKLLDEIYSFMVRIDSYTKTRERYHNSEELIIAGLDADEEISDDPNLFSKIYSYPASERAGRGFTVDIIILEEAAHIPVIIWDHVVVPALGKENMVLLAITTPLGPANYFSRLTQLRREDGEPFFVVHALGLACEECMTAGRGSKCTHMQHMLPAWKSVERHERQRAIYGEEKSGTFEQEAAGMVVQDDAMVLTEKGIAYLANRAPYIFGPPPPIIYTYVDPSGGADGSAMAILSMAYSDGLYVLIGSDEYIGPKDSLQSRLIIDHITRIRTVRAYADALIVFMVEANSSWTNPDRYRDLINARPGLGRVYHLCRNSNSPGVPGVWTSKNSKWRAKDELNTTLLTRTLVYADQFVTAPHPKDGPTDVVKGSKQYIKQVIELQLRNYKLVTTLTHNGDGLTKAKKHLTGKGAGLRDDQCTTIASLVYLIGQLRRDASFIMDCEEMYKTHVV